MTNQKARSVLRNVRIPKELNDTLQREAQAENRTVSALVVSILTKFAEFDRFANKFGFVTVPRSNYYRMIEAMDEQTYSKASDVAPATLLEMVRFWFGRVNANTICDFAETTGKYAGTTRCQVKRSNGEYSITFQHELGPKFSNILNRIFQDSLSTLGIRPETEVTNNSTFIRFSETRNTNAIRRMEDTGAIRTELSFR